MANRHRGEIEASIDGRPHTLCLTLGALAELEDAFDGVDMIALATRFSSGRISARDALRIIGAGLRGAGHSISDDDLARLRIDGGVPAMVDIVARLLTATFGAADAGKPAPANTLAGSAAPLPDPFPGAR
jgi:hypothetical protein